MQKCRLLALILINIALIRGRCDFSWRVHPFCFPPPRSFLGICACRYRHPRGRGGDPMLHARQGSELADLQQAHSERSARRLHRRIPARPRQRRGLQLNHGLLTVGEAEFTERGGGYGLAGTWPRCRGLGGPGGFLVDGSSLGCAGGFPGRCTANAGGGGRRLDASNNFRASSQRPEVWGAGGQYVFMRGSLWGVLGVTGVDFQATDVMFLNPRCS